ncbi:MAG TPA: ketose-bisphosphate aldolase [Gammaproteobacteria bacterium]|nr:ketose-bisphosphate aldolase [Gammaproteobacteria bacterium]
MPTIDIKDMLQHAYQNGYAVGAFDLVSLEFLEGIMEAAERCRSPVILSLAESHFEHYNFELLATAAETAAQQSTVPVAIFLDHGTGLDSAIRAINGGCNGVMVDASHHALPDNIALTRQVVEMAHSCGVPVEGELGYVPGVEGEDAERHPGKICYTTVEEAREYLRQTGVDFLAVSIGTVHGRMKGQPELDIERLEEINRALRIPLVIHGGTGLSDAQFRKLVSNGVAKINYYTALSDAAAQQILVNSRTGATKGYTQLTKGTIDAVRAEAERCMRLWGSAGQAEAVLQSCRPWQMIEHLIIYNVSGIDDQQAGQMAAEGRRILSQIPGVRHVLTGEAVKQDAKYRFCWLIRFVHERVIESYRDHPEHLRFADQVFRPVAGDRISIDYKLVH